MKTPYYMIAHGDDFIRITKGGRVKVVDWEGSQYKNEEQAKIVQGNCTDAAKAFGLTEALKVIVVIDEVRARIKA